MHGATLLDAADRVLRPCILWNDTRSHAEAAALDANPRFRALTKRLSRKSQPQDQLALVLGTAPNARLLSAPYVQSPIDGGRLQITGGFTKSSAQQVVRDLGG